MINYKKIKKKLKNIGLINLIYRRYIYPHLYQSEFDLKIIKKLKFRNVVDVGASSGLYTIELAKISEHCFSFEPIIEEYINLKKIVNKNVKLFNYALSDKSENQYLNIPIQMNQQENPRASLKNTFQNQVKVKVKTIKFDDLKNNEIQKNQFNKIDFIKIDVEGFEHNVIKGMKNTIKINEPIMLIEVEKRHNKEYSKNEFISSFASVFPIENPKYVMIISIEAPMYNKRWGGESAVPCAKSIIEDIIFYDKELIDKRVLNAKA